MKVYFRLHSVLNILQQIIVVNLILLLSANLYAQQNPIDTASITQQLAKVDSMIEVGDHATALRVSDQIWQIANTKGFDLGKAWVLQQRAKINKHNKEYDLSVRNFLEANTLFENLANPNLLKISENLLEVAEVYHIQNALPTAAEYYMQAYEVFKNLSMGKKQIEVLEKAGNIYVETKDYTKAIKNFSSILRLHKFRENLLGQINILGKIINIENLNENYENALLLNYELQSIYTAISDSTGMATTFNNIGYNYSRLKNYEDALKAFEISFEIDNQIYGEDFTNLNTLLNIGITHQNLGNTAQAIEFLLKALEVKEGQEDWLGAATIHNLIAKVYLQNKDYHNANHHTESAISIAESASSGMLLADAYSIKSDIMQQFGDYEDALQYYRMHLAVRDSLSRVQQKESERLRKLNEELDRKDQELRDKIAQEQKQDIINEQLTQNIRLLEAEKSIADYARNEELLENEKRIRNIEAEYQRLQIAKLEEEKKRKELEIRERENVRNQEKIRFENETKLQQAELREKEDEIKLQEKEIQLKEQTSRIGRTILAFVFIGLVMSVLWLLTARRQNKALAKQKDEVKLKNAELEQKTEEVLMQSESLKRANQEVIHSHTELENKNKEIEKQNAKLSKQRDAIENSFKELEFTHQQLKTAQTKLIESEKMASLGQLTAGIAHEINNPINFISGNINPLKRDINDIKTLLEKVKHFQNGHDKDALISDINLLSKQLELDVLIDEVDDLLMGIEEGAKRTKEIVLGLRNFSRLDENDFKLADINQGIISTVTLLKNKMRDKITLHTNFGNIPKIDCLPGQINQVFMNIINNAVQAINEKGNIYIETGILDTDKVKITIRDDGKGIDKKDLSRIFDPFFTTKDVGEGTGLGLSISYGIIKEQHNGDIEVKSKKGEGTTFIITLPLTQEKT